MTKTSSFVKALVVATGILLTNAQSAKAWPQGPGQEPTKPAAASGSQKEEAKPQDQKDTGQSGGPLGKVMGFVIDKLNIKAAEETAGKPPEPLTARQKLVIFAKDSTHPLTGVTSAFYAGISQAADNDHPYGQGAEGFGKRIGAAFGDQLAISFFESFFYPALLREDPRYYRLGSGGFGRRLGHAISHTFVTRRDSGSRSFNSSEWLGAGSSAVISSRYHPDIATRFEPITREAGYRILGDMSLDIAREFVPDLLRKVQRMFSKNGQPKAEGAKRK